MVGKNGKGPCTLVPAAMQCGCDVLLVCTCWGEVEDAQVREHTGMFAGLVGESVMTVVSAVKVRLGDRQLTEEFPCIVAPPWLITHWPEMELDDEFLLLPASILRSPRVARCLDKLIGGG